MSYSSASYSSASYSSRSQSGSEDDTHYEQEKPTKEKFAKNKFVALEADADSNDDEEEDYDEDSDKNIEGVVSDSEVDEGDDEFYAYNKVNQKLNRRKERQRLKDTLARFKNDSSRRGYAEDVIEMREDDSALAQPFQSYRITLEPSHGSVMLFLVKVKKGKEFNALTKLFYKQAMKGPINTLNFAAFTPFLGCEYIYIESKTMADVADLIKGIPEINQGRILTVPYKDMGNAMTIPRETFVFNPGEFVKFIKNDKRGRYYKGDIGQVIRTDRNKNGVLVKAIPRLDYDLIEQDDSQGLMSKIIKEKVKAKANYTAPQNDFDENKIKAHATVETKTIPIFKQKVPFKIYDDNMYYKSFIYMTVPFKNVEHLPYVQTAGKKFEEGITEFESRIPGFKANMYQALGKTTSAIFRVGDVARILDGHEYSGLIVDVKAVDQNGSIITVSPRDKALSDTTFSIESELLEKYFHEGDRVEITAGVNRGKVGTVVSVDEKTFKANVLIVSLNQFEEVELANLAHTKKEEEINVVLGNYKLEDFVKLTDNSAGVIWRIEHETAHILLPSGESRTANLSQIRSKAKDSSARSGNKQPIVKGSVVKVGNKRINAHVLHTTPSTVFLKSDLNASHGGIFVSDPKDIYVLTQTTGTIAKDSSGGFVQIRPKQDTTLKGKTIRIIQGQYKGQLADVKEATENDMRVFLHQSHKVVRLPRSDNKTFKLITEDNLMNKIFSSSSSNADTQSTRESNYETPQYQQSGQQDNAGYQPPYGQPQYSPAQGAASPYTAATPYGQYPAGASPYAPTTPSYGGYGGSYGSYGSYNSPGYGASYGSSHGTGQYSQYSPQQQN